MDMRFLTAVLLSLATLYQGVQGQQQMFQTQQQQQQQVPVSQQQQQGGNECFPDEAEPTFHRPDPAFPPLVENFSYSLFRSVSDTQPNRSVFLSPYSIWSVLSLAYFGAMGDTKTEIETTLGFANKSHSLSNVKALRFYLERNNGNAVLNIANRGYFSRRIPLNRCLSTELFDLRFVDFSKAEAARQAINQDVSTATQGYIPELITFLHPETRFALVNAVFFKGTWETQFDKTLTRPQEFLVPPGVSSGVVDMMSRVDQIRAGEATGLDAMIVELPYLESNISMYLLLPKNPNEPINELVSRLTPLSFATAIRSLPTNPVYVSLSMPKFKLTTRLEEELKSVLASLGVVSLFDPARSNLRGFAPSPPLHVDTAIHQATVEVNEEGTVAAAATAFINTRVRPVPLVLTFNRPFVFMIVDKPMRIPLFIGKINSATDLEKLDDTQQQQQQQQQQPIKG